MSSVLEIVPAGVCLLTLRGVLIVFEFGEYVSVSGGYGTIE